MSIESVTQKRSLSSKMIALCLLFLLYIGHKIMPTVGYYMPSIAYLGVFVLLFLVILTYFPSLIKDNKLTYLLLCFSPSLLTIMQFVFTRTAGNIPMYAYGELQIMMYGLVAICICAKGNAKTHKRMFLILMLFYLITGITTYIGNLNYPGASRLLATLSSSDFDYATLTRMNIGNFTFIYELVMILPLLIFLLKARKIKWVIGVACIVGMFFVVLESEYAMAMLLFVITLFALLFKKLTVKKIIIFAVVAILLFVAFSAPVAGLLYNVAQSLDSSALSERFESVADILSGKDVESGSNAQNRISLYEKSLKAFVSSGFMGTWDSGSVGGHSFVLDTLGEFGLIGLLALCLLYFGIYKLALRPYKDEPYFAYLFLIYVLGIALAILNTKANLFIFIGVIPLFGAAMKKETKRENVV